MTKFVLTIDLTDHAHAENPAAQRQFIHQKLQEATQAICSGYVAPHHREQMRDDPSHPSHRYLSGDITHSAGAFQEKKVIGSWKFVDEVDA